MKPIIARFVGAVLCTSGEFIIFAFSESGVGSRGARFSPQI